MFLFKLAGAALCLSAFGIAAGYFLAMLYLYAQIREFLP